MPAAKIVICLDEPVARVRPEVFGHFAEHLGACIDQGLWVGVDSSLPNVGGLRKDVLDALRPLNIPVLRWPGGCFADDYHWRDGIGPRASRPRTVNIHWGHAIENNGFGTHEFIQLCRYLGAQPYLAGNLGSGTVSEMRNWVEYCNFPGDSTLARQRAVNGSPQPMGVRFWGVGNENWGCGGHFDPEDYAARFKQYATYLRDYGQTELFLIACGPDGDKPDWTRRFFDKLGRFSRIGGFAAHYYCGTAGASTHYSVDQWYELLERASRIEDLILRHRAIMDDADPDRRIGLLIDEWGTWHHPQPGLDARHLLWQQNTLRDALVAALTLDVFVRHADKVVMANIAQMVNVLQAMILTRDDRMILTPTYHVFDAYQTHGGATSVKTVFEAPEVSFAVGDRRQRLAGLSGSASFRAGAMTLSVVNPHAALPLEATIDLRGDRRAVEARITTLCHDDLTAHNTFEEPALVAPAGASESIDGEWRHVFPPASVTVMRVRMV